MAGDWIKMRHDLPTDPDVVEMAARLSMDEFAVVGRLHAVWSWLDKHSDDGLSVRVASAFLDRLAACPGFAEAMRIPGWLEGRDGSLSFPGYQEHNGTTAKSRAVEAKRKAAQRDKCPTSNGTNVPRPPGLEKRRVEENKSPPLPPRGRPAREINSAMAKEGFPEAWRDWLGYSEEKGHPLTSYTAGSVMQKCERWGPQKAVRLIRLAIDKGWKNLLDDHELSGPGGKTVPPPAKPRPPEKPPEWAGQLKAVWQLVDKYPKPDPVQRLQIVAAIKGLPKEAWKVIQGDDYNILNGLLKGLP
jgi:hypothetical protein